MRSIPSVDAVLRHPLVASLLTQFQRDPVVRLVRETIREYREELNAGASPISPESVAERVAGRAALEWRARPRPVVNATGVVLHTNLGRAPLSEEARTAMADAAGYNDLEFHVESGSRGSRQDFVKALLYALTGAADSFVAVNNAAAVMISLAAMARGKEVLVSRGHSVEIGGGFRVPVILRQSGARLVEVGTTNRTRLDDYAQAITERTAAILHVHSSNFRIVGFTEDVPLEGLSKLAHDNGILLIDDNGSGSLLDTADYGLVHEPTPIDSLDANVDLVAFSGDKLLGGPQAGIVLGRSDLIKRVSSHPLARAVRPDKLILASLSATLLSYLRGDADKVIPVWRMISQTPAEMLARARSWQRKAADFGLEVELESGESTVGGGSLPGETLPTTLIVLPGRVSARRLRDGETVVVARTHAGRVLLDLRTVTQQEEDLLLDAVVEAFRSTSRRAAHEKGPDDA